MSIYDKLGAKTAGIKARTVEKPAEKTLRTAPGIFLNTTQRLDAAEAHVEELQAKLKVAESAAYKREVPVDLLDEVPGRRRKLTPAQYRELEDNLRHNEQAEPIKARPKTDGRYEIVIGNNRVDVFKNRLGRKTIWAVVEEMTDEQADLQGFYSNLFHPSLPDYEKYLGFRRRQEQTGKNQKELAGEAGIPEQTLSDLFSFEKLPEAAKTILNDKPYVLGSSAAQKLAQATASGRGDAVVEAIRKLATDERFTQAKAVSFASKAASQANGKVAPTIIKQGKKTFCKMETRRNKLVIEFGDEVTTEEWTKKLEAFMRNELKESD
jgi:ParB family chromosome partitioning protein